jgi:hypothetical protein
MHAHYAPLLLIASLCIVTGGHVDPNLPPFADSFALTRLLVAHSIRAQTAASPTSFRPRATSPIFLRVPTSGACGLAAFQSPAVRIRGSSVV